MTNDDVIKTAIEIITEIVALTTKVCQIQDGELQKQYFKSIGELEIVRAALFTANNFDDPEGIKLHNDCLNAFQKLKTALEKDN